MYSFSTSSIAHLSKVHPDLQKVFSKAIQYSSVDFGIEYPVRSQAEQEVLVLKGNSSSLKSRHVLRPQDTYVHAVDVFAWVNGKISWQMKYYKQIAKAVFRAAIEEQVQIEWGGHWIKPIDGPHFQLSWKEYP